MLVSNGEVGRLSGKSYRVASRRTGFEFVSPQNWPCDL